MRSVVALALTAVIVASCGNVADEPIDGRVTDRGRESLLNAARAQHQGLLTLEETECWVEQLIESNVTPGDLRRKPNDVAYRTMMHRCLDPDADVDESAVPNSVRNDYVTELAEAVGFAPAEADCLLTELEQAGYGMRSWLLASRPGQPLDEEFKAAITKSSSSCR